MPHTLPAKSYQLAFSAFGQGRLGGVGEMQRIRLDLLLGKPRDLRLKLGRDLNYCHAILLVRTFGTIGGFQEDHWRVRVLFLLGIQ